MLELKRTDGITENAYMLELYQLVQRNMLYIRNLNWYDADEIAERVLTHAMQHRNRNMQGTLNAYVRSLAASFSKEINAEKNSTNELDDYTIGHNSNLYDKDAVWVTHEVNYDIAGRKHIVEVLSTQYLITPERVIRYCADILKSVSLNVELTFEEPTIHEIAELKNGTTWKVTEATIQRYTPVTILQGVLETAQAIAKQQRMLHKTGNLSCRCYMAIPADETLLDTITGKATVGVVENDDTTRLYGIHKYSFTMREIDGNSNLMMDFTDWVPAGDNATRPVYAIDITELYNYVYSNIVATQMRDTQLIRFLGKSKNAKYLPSGTVLLNETVENYIIEMKMELLTALLSNGITDILGITDDNVYIRPARRPSFNMIRYTLFNGKQIDMPLKVVQNHKKERS